MTTLTRWLLAVSITCASILIPVSSVHAGNDSVELTKGISSELGSGNLGEFINGEIGEDFATFSAQFAYQGGDVWLTACSQNPCTSDIWADDAIRLEITRPDGSYVDYRIDYWTSQEPNHNVTHLFQPGTNEVTLRVYDVIGPNRGVSPMYLQYNYDVGGPTSFWYNNCQPTGYTFRTPDYAAPAPPRPIGSNLSAQGVWRMAASIQNCDNFTINYDYQLGQAWGFTASGAANGGSYSASVNLLGESQYSTGFPYTENGDEFVSRAPGSNGSISEFGILSTREIGAYDLGLHASIQSEILTRVFYRPEPPRVEVQPVYSSIPTIDTEALAQTSLNLGILSTFGFVLWQVGQTVALPQLRFAAYVTNLQSTMQYQRVGKPMQAVAAATTAPSTAPNVSPELELAVSADMQELTQLFELDALTAPDQVSAYTEYSYTGTGFTPNDIVIMSLGRPGSDELLLQYALSDAAGNVQGTIEMPSPEDTPLGEYLLLAFDYREVEASLETLFANPGLMTLDKVGVAGAVIDVVEDISPPVTTASVAGQQDTLGQFIGDVTLTFEATDDLSGVDRIEYTLDNGYTWIPVVDNVVVLNGHGIVDIRYRAIDKVGNFESDKGGGLLQINQADFFSADVGQSFSFYDSIFDIDGNVRSNGSVYFEPNVLGDLQQQLQTVGGSNASNMISVDVEGGEVTVNSIPYYLPSMEQMDSYQEVHINTDLYLNDVNDYPIAGTWLVEGNVYLHRALVDDNLLMSVSGNLYGEYAHIDDPDSFETPVINFIVQGDTYFDRGINNGIVLLHSGGAVTLNRVTSYNNPPESVTFAGRQILIGGGRMESPDYPTTPVTLSYPLYQHGHNLTYPVPMPSTSQPASVPRIIGPYEGERERSEANISWRNSEHAFAYRVEVATDPAFANVVEKITVIGERYDWKIEEEKTYYLRIKALNRYSDSVWSETRSFQGKLSLFGSSTGSDSTRNEVYLPQISR